MSKKQIRTKTTANTTIGKSTFVYSTFSSSSTSTINNYITTCLFI